MSARDDSTNVSARRSAGESPNRGTPEGRSQRRYALGRSRRIKRRRDFERLFAIRCSAGNALLVVYVTQNELGTSRLGVSVSRRIGGGVKRNRIKRLIREAFRLSQHDIPPDLDVLCIARPVERPGLDAYRQSLMRLVHIAAGKLRRRSDRRGSWTGRRQ